MAQWVRNWVSGGPTGTDADVSNNMGVSELDNDTAPADFDPSAVNSVRFQLTLYVSSGTIVDDSYTGLTSNTEIYNASASPTVAAAAAMSWTPSAINSGASSMSFDVTDSTVSSAWSTAQWEGFLWIPQGGGSWATFSASMKADGTTVSVQSGTITIDYTPTSTDINGTAAITEASDAVNGDGNIQPVSGTAAVAEAGDLNEADWYGYGNLPSPFSLVGIDPQETDATTTSMVFNKPSGVTEGTFMFLHIAHAGFNETIAVWTPPAGWTTFDAVNLPFSSGEHHVVAWYKVAGASEPSTYTVTCTGNVNHKFGVLVAIDGADTTTPIDVYDGVSETEANSTTTVTNNALWIAMISQENGEPDYPALGVVTNPAGTPQYLYRAYQYQGNDQLSNVIYAEQIPTAGVVNRTFDVYPTTVSEANATYIVWALRPTAGISGTAAITEATDTVNGDGDVDISGTAAITEVTDAVNGDGDVDISGTAAITEVTDAVNGDGGVEISGTAAVAEVTDTVNGDGTVPASGTAAVTETTDAVNGDGTVPASGTAAITEVGNSQSAVAVVIPPVWPNFKVVGPAVGIGSLGYPRGHKADYQASLNQPPKPVTMWVASNDEWVAVTHETADSTAPDLFLWYSTDQGDTWTQGTITGITNVHAWWGMQPSQVPGDPDSILWTGIQTSAGSNRNPTAWMTSYNTTTHTLSNVTTLSMATASNYHDAVSGNPMWAKNGANWYIAVPFENNGTYYLATLSWNGTALTQSGSNFNLSSPTAYGTYNLGSYFSSGRGTTQTDNVIEDYSTDTFYGAHGLSTGVAMVKYSWNGTNTRFEPDAVSNVTQTTPVSGNRDVEGAFFYNNYWYVVVAYSNIDKYMVLKADQSGIDATGVTSFTSVFVAVSDTSSGNPFGGWMAHASQIDLQAQKVWMIVGDDTDNSIWKLEYNYVNDSVAETELIVFPEDYTYGVSSAGTAAITGMAGFPGGRLVLLTYTPTLADFSDSAEYTYLHYIKTLPATEIGGTAAISEATDAVAAEGGQGGLGQVAEATDTVSASGTVHIGGTAAVTEAQYIYTGATNILGDVDAGYGIYGVGTPGINEAFAQSYTPTISGLLESVEFAVTWQASDNIRPTDNITVKLYSGNSVDGPVTLLETSSKQLDVDWFQENEFVYETFSVPFTTTLSSGTMYFIVWERTGARDTSRNVRIGSVSSNLYSWGRWWSKDFGTWADDEFDDFSVTFKFGPAEKITASGDVPLDGSAAVTEVTDVVTASGNLPISGTAAVAEVTDTVNGDGYTDSSGTAAITELTDVVTATGDVPLGSVSGTAAITEATDVVAGVGDIPLDGSAAVSEVTDTVAATGTEGPGSAAITEVTDTVAASGNVPFTGTAAVTETTDTVAGVGDVPLDGSAAATEATDSVAATGDVPFTGSAAVAEVTDVVDANGSTTGAVSGSSALTEATDTVTAVGDIPLSAAAAVAETTDVIAGAGGVEIASSAAISEVTDSVTATGTAQYNGSAGITEVTDTVSASGTLATIYTGTANVVEDYDTVTASGIVSGDLDIHPAWRWHFVRGNGRLFLTPVRNGQAWKNYDVVSETFKFNSWYADYANAKVAAVWAANKTEPTATLKAAMDAALDAAGFKNIFGGPLV